MEEKKKKSAGLGRWFFLVAAIVAASAVVAIYLSSTRAGRAAARSDREICRAFDEWIVENVKETPVKTVIESRVRVTDAGIYFNPLYEEDKYRLECLETVETLLDKSAEYKAFAVQDADLELDELLAMGLRTPLDSAKARALDEYRTWCRVVQKSPVSPEIKERLMKTIEEARAKWAESTEMTGWRTTFLTDYGQKEGDIRTITVSTEDDPLAFKILFSEIVGKDVMPRAESERKRETAK